MWDVWISYFGISLLVGATTVPTILSSLFVLTLYSQWSGSLILFFICLSFLNKYFLGHFSHREDGCYTIIDYTVKH